MSKASRIRLHVTRRKSTGALTIDGVINGRRFQRRASSDNLDQAIKEMKQMEEEMKQMEVSLRGLTEEEDERLMNHIPMLDALHLLMTKTPESMAEFVEPFVRWLCEGTAEGEVWITFARQVLELHDRACISALDPNDHDYQVSLRTIKGGRP